MAKQCKSHPMETLEQKFRRLIELLFDEKADTPEFQQLHAELHDELIELAKRILRKLHVPNAALFAEDVVQRWFLVMLDHGFEDYDPRRPFFPFGYFILIVYCYKTLDEAIKNRVVSQTVYEEAVHWPQEPVIFDRMREAVAKLPLEDRSLLALRYNEDLAWAEIAAAKNNTENAVRVRHHRIIKKLRDTLPPPNSA